MLKILIKMPPMSVLFFFLHVGIICGVVLMGTPPYSFCGFTEIANALWYMQTNADCALMHQPCTLSSPHRQQKTAWVWHTSVNSFRNLHLGTSTNRAKTPEPTTPLYSIAAQLTLRERKTGTHLAPLPSRNEPGALLPPGAYSDNCCFSLPQPTKVTAWLPAFTRPR